jgi:hypothetical protein
MIDMTTKTNGKKTQKDPFSWCGWVSPDDPVYTRGLKIGVQRLPKGWPKSSKRAGAVNQRAGANRHGSKGAVQHQIKKRSMIMTVTDLGRRKKMPKDHPFYGGRICFVRRPPKGWPKNSEEQKHLEQEAKEQMSGSPTTDEPKDSKN